MDELELRSISTAELAAMRDDLARAIERHGSSIVSNEDAEYDTSDLARWYSQLDAIDNEIAARKDATR